MLHYNPALVRTSKHRPRTPWDSHHPSEDRSSLLVPMISSDFIVSRIWSFAEGFYITVENRWLSVQARMWLLIQISTTFSILTCLVHWPDCKYVFLHSGDTWQLRQTSRLDERAIAVTGNACHDFAISYCVNICWLSSWCPIALMSEKCNLNLITIPLNLNDSVGK